MNVSSEQFNEKVTNPVFQAGAILILGLIIILGGKILSGIGLMHVSELFPWLINTSFILLFAMVNVVLSLNVQNLTRYWSLSIYSFIGFLLISGSASYLISGVSISNAATYKWLYFMLTFIYLVFIAIARLMRFIVDLAQKQDKRLRNEKD